MKENMIKALRKKFVIINMSFVGLILIIVFISIFISNYKRLENDSFMALRHTILQNKNFQFRPEIAKKPPLKDMPSIASTFTVTLNEAGEIISSFYDNVTVSDEDLSSIINIVLNRSTNKKSGLIKEYKLRYLIEKKNDIIQIAFADRQNEISILKGIFISSIIMLVFGMISFFIISLFLSRWALTPLEKSWKQQKQFVADASHELKTPLTVILANTKILSNNKDKKINNEIKWIESTKAEGERMKMLIDDLLFLAKSDANTNKTVFNSINLSDILLSNLLHFESIAFEKGLKLDSQIPEDIYINGNENQIKQLIAIFLDNACKYTGAAGRIAVSLDKGNKGVLLSVNNDGDSISEADLPHIFDRFYRADQARQHKEGSYGLGLSIAKSIVDAHSAKLWVESNDKAGTTFYVEFKIEK